MSRHGKRILTKVPNNVHASNLLDRIAGSKYSDLQYKSPSFLYNVRLSNLPHTPHIIMTSADHEILFTPFPDKPTPQVSYGLSFPEACKKHVESTFHASRVYLMCSGSLARNTDALVQLQTALGPKVVGTRIGMKPHTLWSEILEIVNAAKRAEADCLVTLGAGSLTDGAKIVAFVRCFPSASERHMKPSRLI